ncbi:MAG TPA: FAD-dependent thymidylate synthase [Chloroflexota bacterium]|nr:FAD-dependent thymidylate synthase [Chloroflexota bacterium]
MINGPAKRLPDGPIQRNIYAVWGVPPETQAYALAKYSRSAQSMLESIAELSDQRAAEFLETFYFQYGHRSIADLAHLALALENISILAAIRVVDEPLWDGQERSTRYQPFTRTKYHVPEGIADGLRERFVAACEELFAAYTELSKGLTELLKRVVPRPDDMDDGTYTRTLRARAFDVTRYLLPLAARTSVGQVVSARVLERQISRLLADPLPECRRIGQELRAACERPAEAPVLRKVLGVGGWGLDEEAARRLLETRAAPTLVKYTAPDTYPPATYAALGELAGRLLVDLPPAPHPTGARPAVELAETAPLEEELVATLLFKADAGRRSYRQVLDRVRALPDGERQDVLDAALVGRGKHDDLLREHRAGYGLVFDVLMDVGGFRDMHRHRRCVQVVRDPDPADGFDDPEEVFRAGLGDDGAAMARQDGHVERYRAAVERAFATADELAPRLGIEARYLLPMAARVRALFKMDYAEAVYIAELRTGTGGHFSYRRVAWAMHQELARRHPVLARGVRVTDPYAVVDLLRR